MDKVVVAKDVALKLADAEAAIDEAIAKAAALIGALAAARGALRVSAVVGQEAAEHLSGCVAGLIAARGEMVACHHVLAKTQAQLGLRHLDLSVDMMGPLDKPPAPSGRFAARESEPEVMPLRAV